MAPPMTTLGFSSGRIAQPALGAYPGCDVADWQRLRPRYFSKRILGSTKP